MSFGFLISSPYQLHHYGRIAEGLPAGKAYIELRKTDLGLTPDLVARRLPNWEIDSVPTDRLKAIDGSVTTIICQTPILPTRFFKESRVVATQYSLAKEAYQYGFWRAHVDLNIMYGPHSTKIVERFANAIAAGNPLLDGSDWWQAKPPLEQTDRPKVLILPTYGDLSFNLSQLLEMIPASITNISVKLHQADSQTEIPQGIRCISSAAHPIETIRAHDLVISSLSGSIYDAIAVRRPVLIPQQLASITNVHSRRLSTADKTNEHVADLTQIWHTSQPFHEAYHAALEKVQRQSDYEAFVSRFFIPTSQAGLAIAEALAEVPDKSLHPVGGPLSSSLSGYVTQNRQLRRENRILRQGLGPFERGIKRGLIRLAKQSRVEAGLMIARNRFRHCPTARKASAKAKSRKHRRHTESMQDPADSTVPSGVRHTGDLAPRVLRDRTTETLVQVLKSTTPGLPFGTDSSMGLIAVKPDGLFQLSGVLRALADDSDMVHQVSVYDGTSLRHTKTARHVTPLDLAGATHLLVGRTVSLRDLRISREGYARVEIVEWHSEKKRWLTRDPRSERVDWTGELSGSNVSRASSQHSSPFAVNEEQGIDVVYTWVDGSNDQWAMKRSRYEFEGTPLISSLNRERFIDRSELKYSLRSLELFCPWVRQIFLVTDSQVPIWLDCESGITIVDHRDIFPDVSVLPVFNSHAIEASLHRIPGLSENFIYMNDDVFVGAKAEPNDFFLEGGIHRVRISPSAYVYDGVPPNTAIPTDWAAFQANQLLRRDFGYVARHRLRHTPHAQSKSHLFGLEESYPAEFAATRASRFRSKSDLAIPSMFAPHAAIAEGRAVACLPDSETYVYADSGRHNWYPRAARIRSGRPSFFCINATRHKDIDLATQSRNVQEFLDGYFPVPSRFELG